MLVALAGCEDKRLDLRNIEAAMRDHYGRDGRVPIEAVTCPEAVKTKTGDSFACTVRFEGGVGWTIEVSQLGQGKTRWTPKGQAVFAADVEPWLAAALEDRGQHVQVQCSERVYVVAPGEPMACTVTTGGRASVLAVAVDAAGALRLLEPEAAPGSLPPGQPKSSDQPNDQSGE